MPGKYHSRRVCLDLPRECRDVRLPVFPHQHAVAAPFGTAANFASGLRQRRRQRVVTIEKRNRTGFGVAAEEEHAEMT